MNSITPSMSPANTTASLHRSGDLPKQIHEKKIDYESKTSSSHISINNLEDLDIALPDMCNAIYDTLGAKNLEATYQRALVVDLQSAGVEEIQSERSIAITYKGHCIGTRRADLILRTSSGEAIVELKAVAKLTSEHIKQLEYYMVNFGIDVGYLINFPHESGFPSVDSLEFAFQQIHLSGPSALLHIPISDTKFRCRAPESTPHIVKLTKRLASSVVPPTPPQETEVVTPSFSPAARVITKATSPPSVARTFGIAQSTGKPCLVCIKQNGYCKYHLNQDPKGSKN